MTYSMHITWPLINNYQLLYNVTWVLARILQEETKHSRKYSEQDSQIQVRFENRSFIVLKQSWTQGQFDRIVEGWLSHSRVTKSCRKLFWQFVPVTSLPWKLSRLKLLLSKTLTRKTLEIFKVTIRCSSKLFTLSCFFHFILSFGKCI